MDRLDAEGIANELGIAKQVAQEKMNELKESERIKSLSNYAKTQVASKKMKARWIKHRVKRKVKGGM